MRKLASIQKIEEIKSIEGADAIEAFRVLGWWVVDRKGAHKVGDLVIYLEIDSWVPAELAPFLSKGQEPRVYNGIKGERLRTIKLRGQVSQGLLLSIGSENLRKVLIDNNSDLLFEFAEVNLNLTEALGIQKWEAPISPQLAGQAAGSFPTSLIPKTDQERIQNCFGDIQKKAKRFLTEKIWNAETETLEEQPVVIPEDFQEPTYEVTMKLDGCLEKNTLISVPFGSKKIHELKIGDKVLSFNTETNSIEEDNVTGVLVRENMKNWYKITTSDGTEIMATENHRFWMDDLKCYRKLSDVKIGDKILQLSLKH